MLLRLQGLVPHPGLLLGVVRFHLCLVALRVRGCQLGELGEAIGIDVLPPLSDDFSQLLERHLPALPRQPRQRRFVDVIVRRLVVVDLGPILRLHDLQDLLPLLLEEVVVAGAWPDGLVGRLLRSAVLLLSLGAFVFTVGCCIGVGIGVGVGGGGGRRRSIGIGVLWVAVAVVDFSCCGIRQCSGVRCWRWWRVWMRL